MHDKLVRIVFDDRVAAGTFEVGGVRVVSGDDETLGRELRTVQVRVHGNADGVRLRRLVEATDGMELTP